MSKVKSSSSNKITAKIPAAKWLVKGSLKNLWKSLIIKPGGGHEKM